MTTELPEPADDGGPLNIALLCFIAYRAMEDRVLRDLAAAGFDDVTAAQGRVFARIGPKGTRVSELAEQARVTKQTAGFLVDQLQAGGYVERVPDPTDARARLVRIAPRGERVRALAAEVEAEVEAEGEPEGGTGLAAAPPDRVPMHPAAERDPMSTPH